MIDRRRGKHLNLLCDIGELVALVAGSTNIQNFLQQTVELTSHHLKAGVCSIYIYEKAADELVLRATVGLNPEAVDKIRMHPGVGLVGTAFKTLDPLLVGSAQQNPHFKYFAEANEDRLESFLAVPIRRGMEKIGVLVIQHEEKEFFNETDITALRALSSQLAGAIENAHLIMDHHGEDLTSPLLQVPPQLKFLKVEIGAKGYARGPVKVFDKARNWLPPLPREKEYTLEDFKRAIQTTADQLKAYQKRFASRLPESASLIFTAHFMFLKDPSFVGAMINHVEAGAPTLKAIRDVAERYITVFAVSPHSHIREKANDIKDLVVRIVKNLHHKDPDQVNIEKERIVIAYDLYPSEILKLSAERVTGIILLSGGATSHVAILAHSLKIPLVIADNPQLLKLPDDTEVLIDADVGNIYVQPGKDIIDKFNLRNKTLEMARPAAQHIKPATYMADGSRVKLLANINLLSDIEAANRLKAEGIGLYRTEFPFLIRTTIPSGEEQYLVYKRLTDDMGNRVVTFRTLDIGGEKVLSYFNNPEESNPDLGLRSIRFSFYHQDIFEQQVIAILRAGAKAKHLRIMFPMISSTDEFVKAKRIVTHCMQKLTTKRIPFHNHPEIGMMIELPAVVEIIDELAGLADFFSIGTNDYIQYMLAVDRKNKKVAEYYQPFHPSVLRSLARIVRVVNTHHKDIAVCGEIATNPQFLKFLLGIGIRIFSIDPQFLHQAQKEIQGIDSAMAEQFAQDLLAEPTLEGIHQRLQQPPPVSG